MIRSDEFRQAMRHWTAGVAIATSRAGRQFHGMTVNSFTSVSLEPAMVTVTMGKHTRTLEQILQNGILGISILAQDQKWIADRFAGTDLVILDRFEGIPTFTLGDGIPLISGGLAHFLCRMVHQYEMAHSVLLVAEVLHVKSEAFQPGLIYSNRTYGSFTPL